MGKARGHMKYLALIMFVMATSFVEAQQLAQYSQYLHNPILLNPATAGINNNFNVDPSGLIHTEQAEHSPVVEEDIPNLATNQEY